MSSHTAEKGANQRERIVIVGSGWAGYNVSQQLNEKKFDITVISPWDTSPYTPLLASAACGLFDFSLAEEPIRHKSKRMNYFKATVQSIDFDQKLCKCKSECDAHDGKDKYFEVSYDRLILAPGCVTNTFNTPGADKNAFFVRNVADAKAVQYRLKQLLELASLPGVSDEEQRDLLHIIVVGGGPTGVEISAEMSDLFNDDFTHLYPNLAGKFCITIHDAAPSILGAFEEALRDYAIGSFNKRSVKVATHSKIKKVESDHIETEAEGRVGCGMVIWTAGNKQCALVDQLDVCKTEGLPRMETDQYLHVTRESDKLPLPDVYALGDAADIKDYFLPTTAEVAVQKAEYLVHVLNRGVDGQKPFRYKQKALVAYIGGHDGVVAGQDWNGPRAWAAWRSKNLLWTRSWRRKMMIMIYWGLDWFGGKEIARL
ncbi:Putative FAD/NAD(P)-binding domain, FAD/NAD(P)-binding domain superfamily [Septoria linicola]|uniref:FAD/NAD(P)-binding domain, FAD/NAD(P)-binding domain superfamily n=1 Tax=Septoria linicola TaxID=215465 RepID=A0A9Q9EFW6_9PEZI|nr:putative FAD/NAD(P)-binding domain, FAD/NAD(P)-binding domain superfamily [Septoria linicola]USW50206.1 Putative FAD/NAD(P)-binding domain, FAD/NAD(P)-binding domain superfamily [Septoria linicola]